MLKKKQLEFRNDLLKQEYLQGKSCQEIASEHNFGITTRQMQRVLKAANVIRSQRDSFKLAIKRGRMHYKRLNTTERKQRRVIQSKVRFMVFKRDEFRCQLCGSGVKDCLRLEVDHIDSNPSNNKLENLQTLCDRCNKGKAWCKS